MVRDRRDDRFYRCNVVAIDGYKIKVHFVGWNKKFDEWLLQDDGRIWRDKDSAAVELQSAPPCVSSPSVGGEDGSSRDGVLQPRTPLQSIMAGSSVIRESGVSGSVGGVAAGSLGGGGHLEELGGADLDVQCAFCKVVADG